MITISTIGTWISGNALWIGLILIIVILVIKLYDYWKINKKDVLKKVRVIQDKYKLPRENIKIGI